VLDKQRYDHFRCLAFASHLIESSKINLSTHQDVQILLEEFNKKFESLYKINLCVIFFLAYTFRPNNELVLKVDSHQLLLLL
jgi:hypothetical protein